MSDERSGDGRRIQPQGDGPAADGRGIQSQDDGPAADGRGILPQGDQLAAPRLDRSAGPRSHEHAGSRHDGRTEQPGDGPAGPHRYGRADAQGDGTAAERGGRRGIPPLDEVLAVMRVVAVPTRTRFRGIEVREAVIFDAPLGASEFSPFPEYGDAEAVAWLAAALDFGWREQPKPLRDRVEVNATVPAVAAEEVRGILARFPGCRTAKVKVAERGQTLADDVARVREVRAAMGPDARVRVDANGGWTVDEAEIALRALAVFDLDYAEQPCATVAELAELRARLSTPDSPPNSTTDQKVGGSDSPVPAHSAGRLAAQDSPDAGGAMPPAEFPVGASPDSPPFDAAHVDRDDGVAGSYPRAADSSDGTEPEAATTATTASAARSAPAPGANAADTTGNVASATRRTPLVRIAADESVRKAADPLAVARAGAADLLVIKAQPLGGVRRALDVVERAGLPVVVSSALDTSVGISMGLRLAAALPDDLLAGACGLGTVALLDGDVVRDSLVPRGGAIPVERPPLDPALLDRYTADPERVAWWRERVARCHALLS